MKNNLIKFKAAETMRNQHTGLTVNKGEAFLSASGFSYFSGVRQFGDLNIREDIASGTAVTYLNGISVFNAEGELLVERKAPKGTHYQRETARQLAKEAILDMLVEANVENEDFNYINAEDMVNKHLKLGYYSKSYSEINKWFESLKNEI